MILTLNHPFLLKSLQKHFGQNNCNCNSFDLQMTRQLTVNLTNENDQHQWSVQGQSHCINKLSQDQFS